MMSLAEPPPTAIASAVRELKKVRPVYAEILDYYQQLLEEQALAADALDLPAIEIPRHQLKIKRENGFPLIDPSGFLVDIPAANDLLARVCAITGRARIQTAHSAAALQQALETDRVDLEALVKGVLHDQGPLFDDVGEQLDVDPHFLRFAVYHAMVPALRFCAENLSAYLKDSGTSPEESGTDRFMGCPICGTPPVFAMLHHEGRRQLYCGFCWHAWPVKRGYCPLCQNMDRETLQYFYPDEEPEYRVDLCDKCKKYLKCLDRRNTDRPIDPRLELVATLHLDLMAQQEGYATLFTGYW